MKKIARNTDLLDNDLLDLYEDDAEDEDLLAITNEEVRELEEEGEEENVDFDSDAYTAYIKSIGNHHLLTHEEEIELGRLKNNGSKEAYNKMVESNLKLVINIAKKYRANSMEIMDIIQEGNLGLMKAVEKFDPERGFRFNTYAVWWIRQACSRAVNKQDSILSCPVHLVELSQRVRRIEIEITQRTGIKPKPSEIAKIVGISESRVMDCYRIDVTSVSLDDPLPNGDDESSLSSHIKDDFTMSLDELAEKEELSQNIEKEMSFLSARDKKIMMMYYGVLDGNEYAYASIGLEVGLSRERVRQIVDKNDAILKSKESFHRLFQKESS